MNFLLIYVEPLLPPMGGYTSSMKILPSSSILLCVEISTVPPPMSHTIYVVPGDIVLEQGLFMT